MYIADKKNNIKAVVEHINNLIDQKVDIKIIALWYKDLINNIHDFLNHDIKQIGEIFYINDFLFTFDQDRTFIRNRIKQTYNILLPYANSYYKII